MILPVGPFRQRISAQRGELSDLEERICNTATGAITGSRRLRQETITSEPLDIIASFEVLLAKDPKTLHRC